MTSSERPNSKRMDLPADESSATLVGRAVLAHLTEAGVDEDTAMSVRLAAHEACINAVRHGSGSDPAKSIHVEWTIHPDRVVITVKDDGEGFDVEDVPDPTLRENLLKIDGRGLLMIREIMDELAFSEGGTRVTMTKRLDTS